MVFTNPMIALSRQLVYAVCRLTQLHIINDQVRSCVEELGDNIHCSQADLNEIKVQVWIKYKNKTVILFISEIRKRDFEVKNT